MLKLKPVLISIFLPSIVMAEDRLSVRSTIRKINDSSSAYRHGSENDLSRLALLECLRNKKENLPILNSNGVLRSIVELLQERTTPWRTRIEALQTLAASGSALVAADLQALKFNGQILIYAHPNWTNRTEKYHGDHASSLQDLLDLAIFRVDPNILPSHLISFIGMNLGRLRGYIRNSYLDDFILSLDRFMDNPEVQGFVKSQMKEQAAKSGDHRRERELEIWAKLLTHISDPIQAWSILTSVDANGERLSRATRAIGGKLHDCLITLRKLKPNP